MNPARFICGTFGIFDTLFVTPCVVDEHGVIHGAPEQIAELQAFCRARRWLMADYVPRN